MMRQAFLKVVTNPKLLVLCVVISQVIALLHVVF